MSALDIRTVHSNALEQGYRRGYNAARRTAKDDLRQTLRRWYHRAIDAEAYAAHLETIISAEYEPGTGYLGAMRERVVLGTLLHHELSPAPLPTKPEHFTGWHSMVYRALAHLAPHPDWGWSWGTSPTWAPSPLYPLVVGDVLREWGTSPGYLELQQLTLERTDEDNVFAVAVELAEIRTMTTRLMELGAVSSTPPPAQRRASPSDDESWAVFDKLRLRWGNVQWPQQTDRGEP